jgi:phosphocarrier protein HPr
MIQGTETVAGELGLHLRAAARLVSITSRAQGPVRVSANGATVDGKSLLGITSLLAGHGTPVRVEVDHDHDEAVLQDVLALIAGRLDGAG